MSVPNDFYSTINISKNSSTGKKYFCSYCRTRLMPLQEDKIGAYICTKCIIEYWPTLESVKKENKFDLPGPEMDSYGNVSNDMNIPIATIDNVNTELSETTYKKQKLPPSYEALTKVGFKFVNYNES